ncbi:DUF4150 domain-containing protein [Enterobacter bugandensis]
MVTQYIARQDGSWKVISTTPDVCKTPIGPAVLPIPYPVIADMGTAVGVVTSVNANGKPLLVLEQSVIPKTQGDEPGTARGIKSGTVGDICEPLEHSKTAFAGGKPVLRHGDAFWMNARNTAGIIVGQPPTPDVPVDEANPPVDAENEEERQFVAMLRQTYAPQATGQQNADAMEALAERVDAFFSDHTDDDVINSAATGGMLNAAGYYSMTPETARNIVQQIGGEAAQTFEQMDTPEARGVMTALQGISAAYGLRQAGGVDGARIKGRVKSAPYSEGCGTAGVTRTCAGEPVDIGSGDFIQQLSVLSLPGSLPLTLSRFYRSRAQGGGIFGKKWTDDWSVSLTLHGDRLHFTDAEGVVLYYPVPGSGIFNDACNTRQPCYRLSGNVRGALTLFNRRTQQTQLFSPAGQGRYLLSAIEDSYGNRIRFFRNAGQLTTISHSDGYTLALDWQKQRLASIDLVTPQPQRLVTCRYDNSGLLSECDTFQFTHLWHEYAGDGLMAQWRDTSKTCVEIGYDVKGRAVSTRSTEGYYNDRFIYDDEQHSTVYLDAEGGETRYWYNEEGLVTRTLDPLGREETAVWENTQLQSRTDAMGRITEYGYTEEGDISHVDLPEGYSLYYDYNSAGQVTRLTAPGGQVWRWDYDDKGSVVRLTDPLGREQRFSYGEQGDLLNHVMPGGAAWQWRYDARHQICEIVAPDGGVTEMEKDFLGRLLSVKDPLGYTTRFRQSRKHAAPEGSVEEINRPDGVRELMRQNGEKLPESITDGEGKTTRYEYGAFDLLTALVRPDGERLECRYDKLTRLNEIINTEGERYQLTYDLAGQLVAETDFAGRTLRYAYDAAGRCVRTTFPDGTHLNRRYNKADRVTEETVTHADSDRTQSLTTFRYDSLCRLVEAKNDDAIVTCEYDDASRLTAETINGRRTEYRYDAERDYVTQRTTAGITERFSRDLMGELALWQIADHVPLLFEHDLCGREICRKSAAGFSQTLGYTPTGMLTKQQINPERAGALNRQWFYDQAYNLTMLSDSYRGTMVNSLTANDQISHATWTSTASLLMCEERFSYDRSLNITRRQTWVNEVMDSETRQQQRHGRVVCAEHTAYRHSTSRIHPQTGKPENGRFVKIRREEVTWTYDVNGRLVEKRVDKGGYRPLQWRYRWDARSQLTGLETPEGERWEYKYDPFGRRISKRCLNRDKPGTDFHWNGDQLAEEIPVNQGGEPAYDSAIRWIYAPGSFTPLARYEKGHLHYAVTDIVGRIQELVTEDGAVVLRGEQQLWGREEGFQREGAPECRLRFAGQYEDAESGLYYNRFRYYDCETGQYLSADPIGLAGGLNLYGYVKNPLTCIDPLGLAGCDLTGNNWKFNSQKDVDLRGTGKTYRDALDKAFQRTGIPREQFEVTKWGKDQYGKSVPVEWQGPGGANVNMDIPAWNNVKSNGALGEGPHSLHIGYQTPGKPRTRGHIFVDLVPATRL